MKLVKVQLPSGNLAVYRVRDSFGGTVNQAMWYGSIVATRFTSGPNPGWHTPPWRGLMPSATPTEAARFDALPLLKEKDV